MNLFVLDDVTNIPIFVPSNNMKRANEPDNGVPSDDTPDILNLCQKQHAKIKVLENKVHNLNERTARLQEQLWEKEDMIQQLHDDNEDLEVQVCQVRSNLDEAAVLQPEQQQELKRLLAINRELQGRCDELEDQLQTGETYIAKRLKEFEKKQLVSKRKIEELENFSERIEDEGMMCGICNDAVCRVMYSCCHKTCRSCDSEIKRDCPFCNCPKKVKCTM